MAVVKANCYNNGMLIASYIQDYVCGFAVANVLEGVKLRSMGINKPILSLSFNKNEYSVCKKYNITSSISIPDNYVKGLKYHIAVDSGMNRCGVKGKDNLLELLKIMDAKDIEGVYSHIYSANRILTDSQLEKFNQSVDIVKKFNREILTHIFATNYKNCSHIIDSNMVRLGIGLYDNAIGVTSEILQIKDIKRGECIGYDGEFVADKPLKIAVCDGGYFDGIIRRFCGQKMAFNADFCNVIGKISMDSFIIDISDISAKVGDKIVVYDTENLSFDNRAQIMNISKYELMTALKGRFEYVYID